MRARALLLYLIFVALPPSATASVVPGLDLKELAKSSDMIVVGLVTQIHRGKVTTISLNGHGVEAVSMTADLDVHSVLKGELAESRLSFQFFIPPPMGYQGIPPEQYGIFFLRRTRAGWQVLDGYHPYVPAVAGAPVARGTPLDRVTAELEYAAQSPQAPVQTKRKAAEALGTLLTPTATASLEVAASQGEIAARALAIAALLERDRAEWIGPAADLLVSRREDLDSYATWRLSHAIELIELRLRDPKPIPLLALLLRSPDVAVRRAGAAALRNTRSAAATGPLTDALQDEDRWVEYQALMGLAEINGVTGEWAPGLELFNKDPDHFVTHWRNWAKAKQ